MSRAPTLETVLADGHPTDETQPCGCVVWAMPNDDARYVPHVIGCAYVTAERRAKTRKRIIRRAGAATGVVLAIVTG